MFLARRNLLQNRTRLGLSVAGVAMAVMLILLLAGFAGGVYRQISAYPDHAPGSVVAAQDGVVNLLAATSLLAPDTAASLARTDGVERAVPILSQFVILDLHGKKQPVYLVGYDPVLGGGPWRLVGGREPQADNEVTIDRVLAGRHDLALGGSFDIMGRPFTVVGLAEGTTSWMATLVFIRKSAAESLLLAPGATSFLLLTPGEGIAPVVLRDRLRGVPGTSVLLKEDMVANDRRLFAGVFSGPIWLMLGIAFFVGTLVVGLVTYTAAVERRREYGVLKAIGARNATLYRVVAAQALLTAGAGAILGLGLAFSARELFAALRPQFLIAYEPAAVVRALIAALLMALAAALFPARFLATLAPADVFRR